MHQISARTRIFRYMSKISVPKNLFTNIMHRIDGEQVHKVMRRRFFAVSSLCAVIAAFLIPAVSVVQQEFAQTGLVEYLSLIVSDFGEVVANWQDYLLGILESVPVTGIIELLTGVFMLLISLKFASRYHRAAIS